METCITPYSDREYFFSQSMVFYLIYYIIHLLLNIFYMKFFNIFPTYATVCRSCIQST
jgi:hypothetical protein